MAAAQSVFQNSRASGWAVAAMVLPPVFLPLLRLGQRLFPSKAQLEMERAGSMLWNTSLALMEERPSPLELCVGLHKFSSCQDAAKRLQGCCVLCNAAAGLQAVEPQLSLHQGGYP